MAATFQSFSAAMFAPLSPLEKNNLSDLAYLAMKNALLSGDFKPGERLILRDVAGKLGISLTPVRDAINHLIAERVLDRGPGGQKGGASVPVLSRDQIRQLMFLRAELESKLAYAAVAHINDKDIDKLEHIVRQMSRCIDSDSKSKYLDLHRSFHFSLYEHARMDVVLDITEILWLRCGPALNAVLPDYVPNLKQQDYHQAALNFLKSREAARVSDSIRLDITEAGKYIDLQYARSEANQ
ncbi:GntR family transcriptional regulator [Advenella kashmirensis]|uniref:GntR family transcriptional regulator n=1 Tax=Advenella kashmirensis TaxID=310575 RepID=UPI000418902F|nr:GntR family transcriptional regulator [Advenella kashmirensis]